MNPYDILGVSPEATEEEIRKAYKRKAQQLHPDKNDAVDAQEMFNELQKAYEMLESGSYGKYQPFLDDGIDEEMINDAVTTVMTELSVAIRGGPEPLRRVAASLRESIHDCMQEIENAKREKGLIKLHISRMRNCDLIIERLELVMRSCDSTVESMKRKILHLKLAIKIAEHGEYLREDWINGNPAKKRAIVNIDYQGG